MIADRARNDGGAICTRLESVRNSVFVGRTVTRRRQVWPRDPALTRSDELLKDQDPKQVLSSDSLLGDLKNALAERTLDVEMDVHLESPAQKAAGNHRHGHGRKTVLNDDGAVELSVPRDRQGPFDPQRIEKHIDGA